MDSAETSPEPNPTELDDVKARVADVIQRWTIGPGESPGRQKRLTEDDAAELLGELAQFDDVYLLDEWLLGIKQLTNAVCHYPLCFRTPRPPKDGLGGRRPTYCIDGLDEGKPHRYDTSWPLREKLRKERSATSLVPTAAGGLAAATRPVSDATRALPTKLDAVNQLMTAILAELERLNELGDVLQDPEKVLAEIDGVQHTARQMVEAEHGERLAAEKKARQLDQQLYASSTLLQEANAAAEEVFALAEQQRVARLETEEENGRLRAEIAATIKQAEQTIATERAELAQQLATEHATMRETVAQAKVDRDRAKEALQRLTLETETALTRANTTATQAQQALTDLRIRHEDLEEKLRTHLNTLRQTEERQRLEVRDLNTTITGLHQQIAANQAEHSAALRQVAVEHRQDVTAQLETQRSTLHDAHEEVVTELRATITRLSTPVTTPGETSEQAGH